MSEMKVCAREDSCPLLLEALHSKVTAEAAMRMSDKKVNDLRDKLEVAEATFAGRRQLMNDLYKASKRCRAAQKRCVATASQEALVAARKAEMELDVIIDMCARPKAPVVIELPLKEGGAK